MLDRYCNGIGRDPAEITRSVALPVDYDELGATRDQAGAAIEAGFGHVVLIVPAPFPSGLARWVADDVIGHLIG